MKLNILCVGDIVGRPGRHVLAEKLKGIVQQRQIDCVIVNAENAAGGSGITPQIYQKMQRYGVNLITLGDHVYKKREIVEVLEKESNICRPANLSEYAAGKPFAMCKTGKGPVVCVISLIGQLFMKPADNPYNLVDKLLGKVEQQAEIILVDFHAEATSEKIAMGYHLDGRVSCVFGTHTHVPTADERILPKGTAYITDIGMTGAHDSVIGRNAESVVKAFRTRMPIPFEVATGDVRMNGIIVTIDSAGKKAEHIERIQVLDDVQDQIKYDSDDGKPENYTGIE